MLPIESPADRAGLFYDGADIALFAQVPDARDDEGNTTIIVERNVSCRFDRSYQLIGNHEGYQPVMLCQDVDMAYIRKDHRVMLKGHVWLIDERQPDGLGLTQCILKHLGKYNFDPADPSVQAGYPYTFPVILGVSQGAGQTRNPDAVNEGNLAYPYTVSTFIDEGANFTLL